MFFDFGDVILNGFHSFHLRRSDSTHGSGDETVLMQIHLIDGILIILGK